MQDPQPRISDAHEIPWIPAWGGFLRELPSTYTMDTRVQADCLNLGYADVPDNTELIVSGQPVVTQLI